MTTRKAHGALSFATRFGLHDVESSLVPVSRRSVRQRFARPVLAKKQRASYVNALSPQAVSAAPERIGRTVPSPCRISVVNTSVNKVNHLIRMAVRFAQDIEVKDDFKLSVVIPNRNRADMLLRAVLSLRDQTEDAIEIIVVDDASDRDLSAEYGWLEGKASGFCASPAAARTGGEIAARAATGSHVFLVRDILPGYYDESAASIPAENDLVWSAARCCISTAKSVRCISRNGAREAAWSTMPIAMRGACRPRC